jgi:phage shock protein PspC (stress-responsive transcriptional regulator)
MFYILNWEGLTMTKQERQFIGNWGGCAAYWQYRHNPEQYELQQPQKQASQYADDTWVRLLWILGTIGFLAVLAKTTLWSMF